MTRVIEDCMTLQSVNKFVKTRHDVNKYLSSRELDWSKCIRCQKKLDPGYVDQGRMERKIT